jgi:glycosyltransferase involved in cell wall biosynthesis
MKVSVVIPVYNEEKRIKACLDSLMAQTEKPDEIIVVDNNCTDKTIDIVKRYPEVIIVVEKKQGMTPARNAGFNSARFEIVAKCDADTILPSNWIKKIKFNFSQNSAIVGLSFPVSINDMKILGESTLPFYLWMFIPRLMIGVYPMIGPGYAIKKDAFDKIKNELCLNDRIVHEDIDLSIHIKKYGKIFHDNELVVASSARRIINNPLSFFGEYIFRFFKMMWSHRHIYERTIL